MQKEPKSLQNCPNIFHNTIINRTYGPSKISQLQFTLQFLQFLNQILIFGFFVKPPFQNWT